MSRARTPSLATVFGRRLKQAREKMGLPQEKLGVLIGLDESCSSARISRYEGGVHKAPVETAIKLADALGVPLPYLYCPDDEMSEVILAFAKLDTQARGELKAWLHGKAVL